MTIPPAPAFGAPLPVTASPDTLALLSQRRSSSAQLLEAPGPDAAQVHALIQLAARVPDHGKLNPWRFVVMTGAPKAALVDKLRVLAKSQTNPTKAEAALAKLSVPPVSVLVVFSPKPGSIPLWEQELSAGAVCMTMLVAADAMGFGANWITDWYGYDADARVAAGLKEDEQVVGFIHLGTPVEAPLERARPDLAQVITYLGA
ncbi:MAG: nitroreductase family protein [Caulobacteraceae bacterium]